MVVYTLITYNQHPDSLGNTCDGGVFLDFLLCLLAHVIVQAVGKGQAVHLLLCPQERPPQEDVHLPHTQGFIYLFY